MATITIRRTKEGGVLGILTEVDGEKIGRLRPRRRSAMRWPLGATS
jgi:hypothetical protein